jgi:DNA-binding winged helix-turn-helix (wHTH) protein
MSTAPKPTHDEFRGRVWHFGECSFDEVRYELRVRDKVAELEAKPLEVLHQLLLRAGDVVRKEDLLDSVWPGVLVVDASLANAVSKLRKVLGEDDTIIKTVPKVGYRLSVPVRCGFSKQAALLAMPEAQPSFVAIPRQEEMAREARAPDIVPARHFIGWTVAAVLLVVLAVGLAALRSTYKPNPLKGPIAILPFENVSSTASLDYLRSALPDQVAMTLSAARSLPIRPSVATSSRYLKPADLQTVIGIRARHNRLRHG